MEDVRQSLQFRWDAFESLPENMKKALASQSLDEVNKVLGKMGLEEA